MTDLELNHMLTKYECSRIIGIRVSQLSMSAPILVQVPDKLSSNFLYIATKELKEKALDINIRRPLPNNKYHIINIKDMMIPDDVCTLEEMLNS